MYGRTTTTTPNSTILNGSNDYMLRLAARELANSTNSSNIASTSSTIYTTAASIALTTSKAIADIDTKGMYSLFTALGTDISALTLDMDPDVEFVPPRLRASIIMGEDVNLTHLLLPVDSSSISYRDEADTTPVVLRGPSDPRLLEVLSVTKFVVAFVRYASIVVYALP
ncbi:unnamed protein product [Didymodactylos carnosus]|uniref:Uncharacterized protein n=2 Tax=Didymodactylos carnosus TaxID=1234261 RepID=A0A813QFL3_9BILA|nr:unnamed protein product [Didymodactylos carnosus]CAF3547801.1 unnamed protein product [Didymodactylos carnosus]